MFRETLSLRQSSPTSDCPERDYLKDRIKQIGIHAGDEWLISRNGNLPTLCIF